jgi:hypothetical protein
MIETLALQINSAILHVEKLQYYTAKEQTALHFFKKVLSSASDTCEGCHRCPLHINEKKVRQSVPKYWKAHATPLKHQFYR